MLYMLKLHAVPVLCHSSLRLHLSTREVGLFFLASSKFIISTAKPTFWCVL